jgi:transcription initiation factor TFIIIB Brf1 subunit/transcription initiation factor TFIIB
MDVFDIFDEIEENYEKTQTKILKNCDNIEENDIFKEDSENCCEHKNVVNESGTILCSDCGVELSKIVSYEKDWRYYGSDDTRKNSDPNRCHIRKIEDKSIFKDVENLGFSEKIVNTANDLYTLVTKGKIYRGNSRKAIIFGCIFHSVKINGKSYTCDSLREIFNLDRKIILKGLKHVNLNAPKTSEIRNKSSNYLELIDEYISKLDVKKEDKENIITLYMQIKNKSNMINRSRPQSVISSLIYYYLCKKRGSNNVSIKEFVKKIKLSELTINKISKEIEKILDNKNKDVGTMEKSS